MVKLTEVEDEHYSDKPGTTGDEVLLADDDDDYTDTGVAFLRFQHNNVSPSQDSTCWPFCTPRAQARPLC